ncbi:SDR family NAD(P)-dependent oxidoreductase [Flavivirga spongiicola]|uniref:Glucose 1-dehydrogenase n=1 Tax=Flavivirga spongiicola TaxID=421621 RepID=A0ABU7XQ24_9FLAO|nr:glucose 1-dehydrogenase [Flavivirga sp. MEBiC05379]MDO5977889.1 glucose 1-dehydrogenase [Flavivirga sp. MEBiC05379]
MQNIDLTGKRALVTGGSQGIGAGICRKLAANGADVFINYYSNKEKAELLVSEIKEKYGVNAWAVYANIAKSKDVAAMFSFVDDKGEGIDILVNNAGMETINHVLEMTEEEWDRVLSINLKGPWLCAQQAGLRMEKTGNGVIINISSIHDVVPRKGLAHYCSSKAGLKMLSKCMSLELVDKNIRVVSVSPGAIYTEMNREEIKKFGIEKFEKWIPSGNIGEVEDVANAVVFLASDMASYIHGADLYIDGGYMNNTIQYDPRPPRVKK